MQKEPENNQIIVEPIKKSNKKLIIIAISLFLIIAASAIAYLGYNYFQDKTIEVNQTDNNTDVPAPTQNQTPVNNTPSNNSNTANTGGSTSNTGGGTSPSGNSDDNDDPIPCIDTCISLGYECGMQTVCGEQVDCGECEIFEANYFVDNTVDDCVNYNPYTRTCGNGNETAYNTIQEAANLAVPGDKIFVRSGVYNEYIEINNSGNSTDKIIFEGERGINGENGENGELITIIDPSTPIIGWVRDESMGFGVYRKQDIGFVPYVMVVERDGDTLDIPRLSHWGDEYDAAQYLAYPPDKIVTTYYLGIDINYWDGIEALYAYKDGTTYLRFRNGENPNNMMIKAAPSGAAILVNNKSNIVINGFKIRGAQTGIELTTDSGNNIIEQNEIINGQSRMLLEDGSFNNHIRNNTMHMNGLANYTPGAWGGGYPSRIEDYYIYGIKEHIYYAYKLEVGRSTLSCIDDSGIDVDNAGKNNEIYGNEIYNTLCAIGIKDVDNLKIYDNVFANTSSFAIAFNYYAMNIEIYDNLFLECHGIRPHELTYPDLRVYIYRNKFFNANNIGDNTYWHWALNQPTPSTFPEIYFYHNSFAGGSAALSISPYAAMKEGLPNTLFVNNVLSSRLAINYNETFYEDPDMVGGFDYNWVGGDYHLRDIPSWAGLNNIYATKGRMWDHLVMPDFTLPENSSAIDSGIDLSQPFTIKGRTYDPLPGMTGNYNGNAPDMGAVEYLGVSQQTSTSSLSPFSRIWNFIKGLIS